MMDAVMNAVQDSCQHAVAALRAASAAAPGTPLTQALVVGVLVWLLVHRVTKQQRGHRLPPGPWALPLLGNLLQLRGRREPLFVTLDRWAREKYGPVIRVYLGPVRCIYLNDLDSINEALVQKGNDYAGRPHVHFLDVITEGSKNIAFADYSQAWKLHRKIAMRALRHYMTGPHLETVVHQAVAKVADRMAAEPGPFDPCPFTSVLMFHVLDTVCFGQAKPYDDPTLHRLARMLDASNKEVGNGFLEDYIPFLKYWPSKRFQRAKALTFELIDYLEKNIELHRQSFSSDNVRDITDSILLAQREAAREESAQVMAMFTDVHVRQTVFDMLGAGVDTSRMTLDWAFLYMAGHPEIQRRAQAEIDAATGTGMPRLGHREQMPYTQAVLQETMRLSSVAPLALPHKAVLDTTVGGYDVPKDTMVMVNLWAVAHDPRLWEEPHTFRPQRFLDQEGKLKTPKAWMPFSAGRRMCLGESVARPELLLLLACFLKRFTFTLPEGVTYDPAGEDNVVFVFNVAKPFKIIATPR